MWVTVVLQLTPVLTTTLWSSLKYTAVMLLERCGILGTVLIQHTCDLHYMRICVHRIAAAQWRSSILDQFGVTAYCNIREKFVAVLKGQSTAYYERI